VRLWILVRSVSVASLLALALVGCDSAEDVTPPSTFADEVPESRTMGGRVLAGTEPVPGALVRVDVSPGYATDADLDARASGIDRLPRTDTTNAAGAYRFAFAPISHDLSIRAGRELLVFRALGVRTFDVPLGALAAPSGFTAQVALGTAPPVKAGNAVAYFVSGPAARALTGDSATRVVRFRQFEDTVTLHAVEYVASIGPSAAVAHGQLDVRVRDGATVTATVPTTPLSETAKPVFEATPPAGFTLDPLEIEMDFGQRTSAVQVARVTAGVASPITVVIGARYAVHGRARQSDGQLSDSGRMLFDPFQSTITLTLPVPISAEAPIDDDAVLPGRASDTVGPTILDAGGVLGAKLRKGVVEHVLTPESGAGPVIRVATSSRSTTLPDATLFGFARPTGRHTWTLQHFGTLAHIDNLSGEDGRVTPPSWTSAPRIIVLR
jgi:hypothetical protein